MTSNRRILERYILKAITPYILISLILLTAILFAQQTVRYLEAIFHGLVLPDSSMRRAGIVAECFGVHHSDGGAGRHHRFGADGQRQRISGDAGGGDEHFQNALAGACLGAIATVATLYLNLQEAPHAQRELKIVLVRSALYKLDSPVEPRTLLPTFPAT